MARRVTVIVGSGAGAGSSGVPGALPGSDRAAIGAAAVALGGAFDAAVWAGDVDAMRYALAAGARSAAVLDMDGPAGFDVLLVGAGGCGEPGDLLPARLAESQGAALVLEVLGVEDLGDALRVTRDLGRGAREVLRVTPPAVLVMSGDAPRGAYVSRHRLRSAHVPDPSASSEQHAPQTQPRWDPVRPRTRTGDLATRTGGSALSRLHSVFGVTEDAPTSAESSSVIMADPATCAKHLLRFLAHFGFIEKSREPASPGIGQGGGLAAGSRSEIRNPERQHDLRAASPREGKEINVALLRGPRPLDGSAVGALRRPRPGSGQSLTPPLGRLTRLPRPAGRDAPRRFRGPFPLKGPADA